MDYLLCNCIIETLTTAETLTLFYKEERKKTKELRNTVLLTFTSIDMFCCYILLILDLF